VRREERVVRRAERAGGAGVVERARGRREGRRRSSCIENREDLKREVPALRAAEEQTSEGNHCQLLKTQSGMDPVLTLHFLVSRSLVERAALLGLVRLRCLPLAFLRLTLIIRTLIPHHIDVTHHVSSLKQSLIPQIGFLLLVELIVLLRITRVLLVLKTDRLGEEVLSVVADEVIVVILADSRC
jgi:hypothetical protein